MAVSLSPDEPVLIAPFSPSSPDEPRELPSLLALAYWPTAPSSSPPGIGMVMLPPGASIVVPSKVPDSGSGFGLGLSG